jgi:erythronate-4-phosphate dehydrogenase
MKFVIDKNIPLAEEAFSMLADIVKLNTTDITAGSVHDADVLIVRSETKVARSLLHGSKVRFVGTATIGTDHIDVDYLKAEGITFASAPGCNSNSVKEYIVAGLLHCAKNNQFSLKGKTIGVVGVGNVGSKVVQAANALGMTVLQNDPPRARKEQNTQFVPLDALMDVDILTIHTPLTKTGNDPTYHLFDAQRLKKLNEGIIFINSSRGAVVDTPALISVIQERRLSSTIIDVWENEPGIDTTLLPIVTLGTPHIAGYSFEGKINGTTMIRDAVCRYLGLDSSWNPWQYVESPAISKIDVPRSLNSLEEVLCYIVHQCYDISVDDVALKRLSSLPSDEQGIYFRGLRAGYRIRREFSNVAVHLHNEHSQFQDNIVALGFNCNAKQ